MAFIGIAVASVAAMMIGMLWYSPLLFAKQWMKLTGIDPAACADKQKPSMAPLIFGAFMNNVIMIVVLYYLVRLMHAAIFLRMATIAVLVWVGFIATSLFSQVIWEKRPFALYLINIGHWLAVLLAACAVYWKMGLGI